MELHPVTITIGVILAIIMLVVVGTGLGCTVYKKFPDTHPELKHWHDFAKSYKLC